MTKDVKAIAHRRAQIEAFQKSEVVKRYLEHRDGRLMDSLVRGANKALDRIDAENAERKQRGEAPLPPRDSELTINGGVVLSEFDRKTQRENALAEQHAAREASNDVFEL